MRMRTLSFFTGLKKQPIPLILLKTPSLIFGGLPDKTHTGLNLAQRAG
jgi:hypothetical protein